MTEASEETGSVTGVRYPSEGCMPYNHCQKYVCMTLTTRICSFNFFCINKFVCKIILFYADGQSY